MKKLTTLILLIAILLALSIVACGDAGGNSSAGAGVTGEGTPVPDDVKATMSAADATATYGAEQFYLQLTAIAEEGQ